MFFDLNVPIKKSTIRLNVSKKTKQSQGDSGLTWTPSEIEDIEARLDALVHLGYSVIGLTQTVNKRVDPKTHVNVLESLVGQLRSRPGVVLLKRLSIILDQDSEKGFGLINANLPLFNAYDLIALVPTTHNAFSVACLTHSLPSPLTAHIISLPLTIPRLPFHLKHTLIRTAIKNGAVFEINYVGAIGGENEATLLEADAAENGPLAKRNWWASTRELIRVTKGKGLITSGGVVAEADLRAPRDVANLLVIQGLSQDAAHEASTKAPKSMTVRAQTRKTYRAVISEPKIVFPAGTTLSQDASKETATAQTPKNDQDVPQKRSRDEGVSEQGTPNPSVTQSKKKKRKPNQEGSKTVP